MDIVLERGFGEYEKQAWELTKAADKDFVPPLSARNSTVQKKLDEQAGDEEPYVYFDILKNQMNLMAVSEGRLMAFMSYLPDYTLSVDAMTCTGQYISTIITDKTVRRQGMAKALYMALLERTQGTVMTRTWSENAAHLHLLGKLGFDNFYTIPNDRGPGIDTVYYRKVR